MVVRKGGLLENKAGRVRPQALFLRLPGWRLLTNPPYGIRLRDEPNVQALYRDLGDFLKRRCPGAVAHVYVGDRALLKHIGLRSTSRRALVNGALDGRLCRFDLFTGRWRASRSG